MVDEFESINSKMPDLQSVLAQRIMAKNGETSADILPPPGTADPYQLMLKRKKMESEEVDITKDTPVQKWPEADVNRLRDYCTKMGIVGFSSGRMSPIAALAMLKKQFGEDFSDVPLEQRVPEGHEKLGTLSGYGPNYPYSQAIQKKQILHG